MITWITNYFTNLNDAGRALFIVGVLLVITFIVLLIVVFKPEKNDIKKVYGESPETDRENAFEEKMKDIDNVSEKDINIDNDKTRNLKYIVDELKHVEDKNSTSVVDKIEEYEDEQEDTAIISVEELLKSNKPVTYAKKEYVEPVKKDDDFDIIDEEDTKEIKIVGILDRSNKVNEEKKYTPRREVFSSVFADTNDNKNEDFLNDLKKFRNNL